MAAGDSLSLYQSLDGMALVDLSKRELFTLVAMHALVCTPQVMHPRPERHEVVAFLRHMVDVAMEAAQEQTECQV